MAGPLLLLLLLVAAAAAADEVDILNSSNGSKKTLTKISTENQKDVEFWEQLRQKDIPTPVDYIKDLVKEAESNFQKSSEFGEDLEDRSSGSNSANDSPATAIHADTRASAANVRNDSSLHVTEENNSSNISHSNDSVVSNNQFNITEVNATASTNLTPFRSAAQARQLESGSALTAAVMFGAPILAGALYAGASAPDASASASASAQSVRQVDVDRLRRTEGHRRQEGEVNEQDEANFSWQGLLQRTVGNIRDTARVVEDSVMGLFDSNSRNERPAGQPNINNQGNLPLPNLIGGNGVLGSNIIGGPGGLGPNIIGGPGGFGPSGQLRQNNNKKRRRKPGKQPFRAGVGGGDLQVRVPFMGGEPVFSNLNGIPIGAFHRGEAGLEQLGAAGQLQQPLLLQHQLQQLEANQLLHLQHQREMLLGQQLQQLHLEQELRHRQQLGLSGSEGGLSEDHSALQRGDGLPVRSGLPEVQSALSSLTRHGDGGGSIAGAGGSFFPSSLMSNDPNIIDGHKLANIPIEQFVRVPETGQVIPINSLVPGGNINGVRRFDGMQLPLHFRDGGPVRRFDESFSGIRLTDGLSALNYGPIRRVDSAADGDKTGRSEGEEVSETEIEDEESELPVAFLKQDGPQGRKFEIFEENIKRNDSKETGNNQATQYTTSDGQVHFLGVPKRYQEMRRRKKPAKQRRRKQPEGGVQNVKPINSQQFQGPKNQDGVNASNNINANRMANNFLIAAGQQAPRFQYDPMLAKQRHFNHRYITSGEGKQLGLLGPETDSSGYDPLPLRRHFLGEPHSAVAILDGSSTVRLNNGQTAGQMEVSNFTTSFRVFNADAKEIELESQKQSPGRLTFSEVYTQAKPESVISESQLQVLKSHKTDLHPNHSGYKHGQISHGSSDVQNAFEVFKEDSFNSKDHTFVIGDSHHRKINQPGSMSPISLQSEIGTDTNTQVNGLPEYSHPTFKYSGHGDTDNTLILREGLKPNIEQNSNFNRPNKAVANAEGNSFSNGAVRADHQPKPVSILDYSSKRYFPNRQIENHENIPNTENNDQGRFYNNNDFSDYYDSNDYFYRPSFRYDDGKGPGSQYPVYRRYQTERSSNLAQRHRPSVSNLQYHEMFAPFDSRRDYEDVRRSDDSFHRVNLKNFSNNAPLIIRPASFEVFKVFDDKTTSKKQENIERSSSYNLNLNKELRHKDGPVTIVRKKPPSLSPPNVMFRSRTTLAALETTTIATTTPRNQETNSPIRKAGQDRLTRIRKKIRTISRRPQTNHQIIKATTIPSSSVKVDGTTTNTKAETRRVTAKAAEAKLTTSKDGESTRKKTVIDKDIIRQTTLRNEEDSLTRPNLDVNEAIRGEPKDEISATRSKVQKPRGALSAELDIYINKKTRFPVLKRISDSNENEKKLSKSEMTRPNRTEIRTRIDNIDYVARQAEIQIKRNQDKISQNTDDETVHFYKIPQPTSHGVFGPFDDKSRRVEQNPHTPTHAKTKQAEEPIVLDTESIHKLENYGQRRVSHRLANRRVPPKASYERRNPSGWPSEESSIQRRLYDDYPDYPYNLDDMSSSASLVQENYANFIGAGGHLNGGMPLRVKMFDVPVNSDESFGSIPQVHVVQREQNLPFYSGGSQNIQQLSLSFTPRDAGIQNQNERLHVKEKLKRQSEPKVITIDDFHDGSADHAIKRIIGTTQDAVTEEERTTGKSLKKSLLELPMENDPIVNNLKAIFLEDALERRNGMKTSFWQDGSTGTPMVDSSDIPKTDAIPFVSFPKVASLLAPSTENRKLLYVQSEDFRKPDGKKYANIVVGSELSYGSNENQRKHRSYEIDTIVGKISKLPQAPRIYDNLYSNGRVDEYENLNDLQPMMFVADRPADLTLASSEEKSKEFKGKAIVFESPTKSSVPLKKSEKDIEKNTILFGQSYGGLNAVSPILSGKVYGSDEFAFLSVPPLEHINKYVLSSEVSLPNLKSVNEMQSAMASAEDRIPSSGISSEDFAPGTFVSLHIFDALHKAVTERSIVAQSIEEPLEHFSSPGSVFPWLIFPSPNLLQSLSEIQQYQQSESLGNSVLPTLDDTRLKSGPNNNGKHNVEPLHNATLSFVLKDAIYHDENNSSIDFKNVQVDNNNIRKNVPVDDVKYTSVVANTEAPTSYQPNHFFLEDVTPSFNDKKAIFIKKTEHISLDQTEKYSDSENEMTFTSPTETTPAFLDDTTAITDVLQSAASR